MLQLPKFWGKNIVALNLTSHCCIESYLTVEKEKCALQFNTTSKHVEQVSEDNDDAADHDDDQGEDEVEVEG